MSLAEIIAEHAELKDLIKSRIFIRILELAGRHRSLASIARDVDLPEKDVERAIRVLERLGLLRKINSRWTLTDLGKNLLDAVEKEY